MSETKKGTTLTAFDKGFFDSVKHILASRSLSYGTIAPFLINEHVFNWNGVRLGEIGFSNLSQNFDLMEVISQTTTPGTTFHHSAVLSYSWMYDFAREYLYMYEMEEATAGATSLLYNLIMLTDPDPLPPSKKFADLLTKDSLTEEELEYLSGVAYVYNIAYTDFLSLLGNGRINKVVERIDDEEIVHCAPLMALAKCTEFSVSNDSLIFGNLYEDIAKEVGASQEEYPLVDLVGTAFFFPLFSLLADDFLAIMEATKTDKRLLKDLINNLREIEPIRIKRIITITAPVANYTLDALEKDLMKRALEFAFNMVTNTLNPTGEFTSVTKTTEVIMIYKKLQSEGKRVSVGNLVLGVIEKLMRKLSDNDKKPVNQKLISDTLSELASVVTMKITELEQHNEPNTTTKTN